MCVTVTQPHPQPPGCARPCRARTGTLGDRCTKRLPSPKTSSHGTQPLSAHRRAFRLLQMCNLRAGYRTDNSVTLGSWGGTSELAPFSARPEGRIPHRLPGSSTSHCLLLLDGCSTTVGDGGDQWQCGCDQWQCWQCHAVALLTLSHHYYACLLRRPAFCLRTTWKTPSAGHPLEHQGNGTCLQRRARQQLPLPWSQPARYVLRAVTRERE